ncbi:creatininase family protein [Agriterribacter sp.]|uniref:creatininase family protein n=1 Tax=Agriterribacter sp. TaxID=2821509 RepID=UPI002CF1EFD9|nr:creatininase family protein [Agriterribacter sp.]HRO47951.1 creatininase family protein [Agriterribacter sp.]HRQ18632.1 creatininase family protein [Agriterribacter sp.]
MIWDQLTSNQIAGLDKGIPVLLPVSATEQHGAHLPLATDRIIGEHFLYTLNNRINPNMLILPSVGIGCSDHHMDFEGTLTLSHHTFSLVAKEIIESVLHHGFYKIILFNSHGGNQGIAQVILEELGYKYRHAHFVSVTWWVLVREALMNISETGVGGTGHACELETSVIEFAAGHLVDKDQIRKGANEPTFKWAEGDMLHGSHATSYRTMKAATSNGIFGDPTKASLQKGKRITESVVKAMEALITDLLIMDKK